jgi:hypothetical protein
MTTAIHWLLHWSLKADAELAGMTMPPFAHYLNGSFTTSAFPFIADTPSIQNGFPKSNIVGDS